MVSLVPNSAVLTPTGDTPQDHLTALHSFFSTSATSWEVIDISLSGDLVTALLIQQGTQQVFFDVDSGNVRCQIDPSGTRTVVEDAASSDASTLEIAIASGTYSANRAVVSELPDAFFWAVYDATNTFYEQAVHVGVVYVPFDDNDLTGHGMLVGEPRLSTSGGSRNWLSTNGDSRLWLGSAWDDASLITNSGNHGGQVGGRTVLPPPGIKTRGLPADTDYAVYFGFLRYVRQAVSSEPPRTVLPSTTSDQGWLYLGYSASNHSDLIPWDKTITP